MKLIVRVENSIEAAGLLWYFSAVGYKTSGLHMLTSTKTVIIDPQSTLLYFYEHNVAAADHVAVNVCNADIGIEAIRDLLVKLNNAEVEVGDTVVFDYDGYRTESRRVILVKEVDAKYVKGLDVLDTFNFKSFRRDKISNLKQVKA